MAGLSRRSPWTLVVASAAWMALAGNLALWRELYQLGLLQDAAGLRLAGALAGVAAGGTAAVLSLLAWRGTLKPAVLVLLAATALASHFMLRYHVVIDRGMLVNALQTDVHESAALLDAGLLQSLLLGVVLPGWVAWRWPLAHAPWPRQALRNLGAAAAALALAILLVLLAFQPFASAMRNHKQLRYLLNPLNSLYAAGQLAAAPWQRGPRSLQPLGRDARVEEGARPRMLLLVVGETARAGNFGINGYERRTTPQLEALGVASFRDAWACGTSTAASLPCMFSHLGRAGFEAREQDHENLLDVLSHAGLAVLWVDNQSGCKGVCDRIAHAQAQEAALPQDCPGGECPDAMLLHGLQARIDALPPSRRERGVVVVLHQMGSHGPAYWQRSPASAKRFHPECTSIRLEECTGEALRNAYDNSIAYTDTVLADAIRWLQAQGGYDTALVYLSDHGESLGENNLYLHGMPWRIAPDVQKQVPWITWLSAGWQAAGGATLDCLRARAAQPVSHDHLFHSVLGLMRVATSVYRPQMDAYAGCLAH